LATLDLPRVIDIKLDMLAGDCRAHRGPPAQHVGSWPIFLDDV
jgi:hypothetical protein